MLRRIRRSELNDLAAEWHFSLDERELDEFAVLTEYVLAVLDELDHQDAAPVRAVVATREPGRRPAPGEDPCNAIVRWCRVKAEAEGILSGLRLGFKDAIAVAGVPMTCGSRILQGFVPTQDSVVAERVLLAGGEIVAITNMDNLAFSGGGDTSAYGSTLNPFDTRCTAGGSSGGSGAALWYDGINITLGGDQGGSIRVPAAWCGVLGLKPTHGLVPYTSIAGIDQTFDHCGPMARSAADAARLLQAIAGKDESDPRQREVAVQDYMKAVAEARDDFKGMKIGVVPEGFSDAVGMADDVAEAVRGAIERLRELGAEVRETSLTEHLHAGGIAFAGFIEGMTALVAGGGNGYHWRGTYWPEFALALGEGLVAFGDELSPQMKLTLICGTFLRRNYFGSVYATAQNLRPALRAGYDRALREVDYLVMPTTPCRPHVNDLTLPISQHVKRGWAMLTNTAPTDMTGHPALTIPAAETGGLPAGVMLVGRHFDDAGLLALARTYEQRFGWVPVHPSGARR